MDTRLMAAKGVPSIGSTRLMKKFCIVDNFEVIPTSDVELNEVDDDRQRHLNIHKIAPEESQITDEASEHSTF